MNTFKSALAEQMTVTENGMPARVSTANICLDLFGVIGASRTSDIKALFSKAYNEDRDKALRIAQFARDCRGGLGERKVFLDILNYLEVTSPNDCMLLMNKIPELGYWKDFLCLKEYITRQYAFNLIRNALEREDGLCAKYMPREGMAGYKTFGHDLRKFLGLSPKNYRKKLKELSATVESQMCAKKWEEINFEHVPSVAMARYKRAFSKHQCERFGEYLGQVKSGEKKINASAVFPHDVVKVFGNTYIYGRNFKMDHLSKEEIAATEAQWNALPNYVGDASIIPIVDTSSSMNIEISKGTTAWSVSVALGMYLADKNQSPKFKGCFVSFADRPRLSYVNGSIVDKYKQVSNNLTMGSTNLEGTFDEILKVCKSNSVPQEEMPQYVMILSDMQFNQAVAGCGNTALQSISRQYEEAGYKRPNIIFWNLVAKDNVPVRFDDNGTAFVSGYSPALMKTLLKGDLAQFTPLQIMLDSIMIDKYNI